MEKARSASIQRLCMGVPFVLMAAGCAGASLQRGILRHDVGRGSRGDIQSFIPETLIRHGYHIQQHRDTGTLIYYETAWLHREPFEDEVEACASECRSRIIVEARRRGGNLFSVTLRAENAVLAESSGLEPSGNAVWTPLPPTDRFREHVGELSTAIAMRIDAGVRVFR